MIFPRKNYINLYPPARVVLDPEPSLEVQRTIYRKNFHREFPPKNTTNHSNNGTRNLSIEERNIGSIKRSIIGVATLSNGSIENMIPYANNSRMARRKRKKKKMLEKAGSGG